LDEASADLLEHYPEELIRIGGRCGPEHSELQERTLHKLTRAQKGMNLDINRILFF
jgi:hypothetical protein